MARHFGCDPNHPNVAKQKQYQENAFHSLSLALTIDESNVDIKRKALSIPHYQSGIEELKAGIALHLPIDENDQNLVRAHKLKKENANQHANSRGKTDLSHNCTTFE